MLNDAPGTGKTTLALAFSKALGLDYKRIQFTTDTLPSDINGFTMFNRQTNEFEYREGAANCQLLLADEISTMLDVITQAQIWNFLIEETEKRNIGMVIVSHNRELLNKVCTRIVEL